MRRAAIFALACVTAVLVSSELALTLPIGGAGPDVLILVVVAFAVGSRPLPAALSGFAAGLLRDLLLDSAAGPSALAYGLTAYAVGVSGAVRGVWAFLGIVAGATFSSQLLYGFARVVLSPDAPMAPLLRVAVATTVYNSLLTPLLIPVLRRFTVPEHVTQEGAVP